MFITHNLSVVKHISDSIMVMYLGQCVEIASSDELFANPLHPYTRALLDAIPRPTLEGNRNRKLLRGEVFSPIDPDAASPVAVNFAARNVRDRISNWWIWEMDIKWHALFVISK